MELQELRKATPSPEFTCPSARSASVPPHSLALHVHTNKRNTQVLSPAPSSLRPTLLLLLPPLLRCPLPRGRAGTNSSVGFLGEALPGGPAVLAASPGRSPAATSRFRARAGKTFIRPAPPAKSPLPVPESPLQAPSPSPGLFPNPAGWPVPAHLQRGCSHSNRSAPLLSHHAPQRPLTRPGPALLPRCSRAPFAAAPALQCRLLPTGRQHSAWERHGVCASPGALFRP